MKLYQLKIFIVFFLVSKYSIAQSVEWGEAKTPKEVNGTVVSLGWHDGFLYNLQMGSVATNIGLAKISKKNIRLEKVSKNAEVIFSKDLSLEGVEDFGYHPNYAAIIKDSEVRIFYIYEKRGKNALKSVTYDIDGNLKKNGIVYQYEKETCFSELYEDLKEPFATNKFSFSISPNELKVGVTSVCKSNNKEYEITTVVFNADGSEAKVHKKRFNSEGKISRFINRQLAVDDAGNMVFNYNIQEAKPKIYITKILAFSNSGKILANKELGRDGEGVYHDDIFIKFSKNNEAFIAGVAKVSNDDKSVFFTKFELSELGDLEMPTYFRNHKLLRTEPKYVGVFYFDIKFGEDGKGFLILNLIARKGARSADGSGSVINRNKGLLVFPFGPEAKLGSITIVPKLHDSYIERYPSCVKSEMLYLLYDNHKYNITVDNVEQMKNPYVGRSAIFLATVSADNLVKRKILFSESEVSGDFQNAKTHESENGFLICVSDDWEVQYGKVDF